MHGKWDKLKF